MAGKLFYLGYTTGQNNLAGKVSIAEGLTVGEHSVAIKDIVFNNFYGTSESQQYSIQPVERVIMGDTVYASRFIGPLYAAGFEQVISAQIAYKKDSGLADLIAVPINVAPSLTRDDITVEWIENAVNLEEVPVAIPELKE